MKNFEKMLDKVVAFFVIGNLYPQKNNTDTPQAISGEYTRNDITVKYIPRL